MGIERDTDVQLAENTEMLRKLEMRLDITWGRVHDMARDYRPRKLTHEQAIDIIRWDKPHYASAAEHLAAEAADTVAQINALRAENEKLHEVYVLAGGWSRFFLVPGGHIHSSTYCPTCNRDGKITRFSWLPELSGQSEETAVAERGAILCTVCYPSAPVEWTNAIELAAQARKAAQCPASGEYYLTENKVSRRYAKCHGCAAVPSITASGKLRAHKPVSR